MSAPRASGEADRCETCRFMYTGGPFDRSYGQCRRFPPVVTERDPTCFPEVRDADWCGEYQPLLQERNQ